MPTKPTAPEATRRDFLAASATASGLLLVHAAPTWAQRTPLQMPRPPQKKLGYAMVGLGKFCVEQLLPGFAQAEHCKVTALVSGVPDKARKLAERFGVPAKNIYNYENFDRLKDNPDVDIVYVVLPNMMHCEYTVRAAQAGKHVLCEKPMAVTSAECRQMIDACKKADRKLMIGYRLRYEPTTLRAVELARGGEVGKIELVVATMTQNQTPNTWRTNKPAGGGPLPDIGVYTMQAARYMTGEEPSEVSATLTYSKTDPRFKDVEQRALFSFRFPGGAEAQCAVDFSIASSARFRAIGKEGAIDMDPAFAYHGLKLRVMKGGKQEEHLLPDINQFAMEMDHLAVCVKANQTPRTPGEEGLRDCRLIELVREAAEGGKPVKCEPAA